MLPTYSCPNASLAVFHQVTGEMIASAIANFMKGTNLVVEANDCRIEK